MTLGSPTFGTIIDEVLTNLHGHTQSIEQLTALNGAVTDTALTLTVDDASQVTRGLIEIDSELMWVTSTDHTANTVTIAPFGRGFRETDAAAHADKAMVTNSPRFPRQSVKQAIQETMYSIYPDVFAVKSDETNTVNPVVRGYSVPADCDGILEITAKPIGPSALWSVVRRWRLDTRADTTAFTTGKAVNIFEPMPPGQPIKILYTAQPDQLVNETDLLSATGLQDTVKDVLVYGACARLVANVEISRLQSSSITQAERDAMTPPGAAMQAARYFDALYEQALQREVYRLRKTLPDRTHMDR